MNGKQLKNSILQWAIQGKLVPQDANDEPAIELLKRINPKIKPITEDVPFEVPENWCWVELGIISNYGSCSNIDVKAIDPNDWVLELEDIEKDSGKIIHKISKYEREIKGVRHQFTTGQILFSKLRTYLNKVLVADASGYCTTEIIPISLKENISPKYICYVLRSPFFLKYTQMCGYGIKMPRLSTRDAKNGRIPLPPLAEQKRIVAKIEELMPLVERYTKAQEGLDKLNAGIKGKLRASILQEAIQGHLVPQDANEEPAIELLKRLNPKFTPPEYEGELPQGWSWCKINDYVKLVTDFVASGSFASLRENVTYYKEENYAILVRTLDLQNNFTKSKVYTDKHGYDFLNNSNLEGGELILPNVGSIGKVFIVPKLDKRMTLAPNSIMLRFHDESHIAWFYYLFSSLYGQSLIHSITSKTAQPKFNKTSFRNLTVPLPPLAEQKRIVAKIEELFAVLDNGPKKDPKGD